MIRRLMVVVPMLLLAGCATSGTPASGRGGDRTQVRCLADAGPGSPDTVSRPLFFLFCIQAP